MKPRLRSLLGISCLLLLMVVIVRAEMRQAVPTVRREPNAPAVDLYGDPLPPGAIARLGTVRFHKAGSFHNIAFSPDSRMIATAGAEYWDRTTGHSKIALEVPFYFDHFVFTPDGRTVIGTD